MVEIAETPEAKLKRHEDALAACMVEITRLREENARLRSSENTAHSVLREVYNDPSASPHVRVLAAKAAISHESAPLKPVTQLELKAEPERLPLAELVRLRRARSKAMEDPGFPGGIVPPDHPRARAWSCATEAELQEKVRRWEAGEDISGGNGDNSNSGGDNTAGS